MNTLRQNQQPKPSTLSGAQIQTTNTTETFSGDMSRGIAMSSNPHDDNSLATSSKANNTAFIGETQTKEFDTFRFTNEGDMPVVEHVDSMVNDLTFTAIGSDNTHGIAEFVQRPYLIHEHVWDTGSMEAQIIDPWAQFRTNPAFSKLQGLYAIEFTMVFRLVTNNSPYITGLIQLAFSPCEVGNIEILPNPDNSYDLVPTLSGGPSLVHNISAVSVSELRVRYKAPRPIYDLNERNYGRVYMHSLTQLRGTTNNDFCSTRLYMWLEDLKTYGTNIKSVRYQGRQTQTKEAQERSAGPVETIANTVNEVSSFMTKIPVVADVAGPVSWLSSAVGGVASMLGMSKPFDTLATQAIVNNPYKEMAFGRSNWGVATKMTMNDDACIATHPLGNDPDDEMSIAKLLQKPNYYRTFTWTTSDAAGNILVSTPITPGAFRAIKGVILGDVSYNVYQNTMMSYLASLFGYWCGTIKLTFTFAATKFHSGRVRFVYVPEPDPTTQEVTSQLNYTYSHILDIRDSTTVTIDVPFISTTPWKKTFFSSAVDASVGMFYVLVENELLAGTSAATTVDVTMHISGCDFQFAVPRLQHGGVINSVNRPLPARQIFPVAPSPESPDTRHVEFQGLTMDVNQEAPASVIITNCDAKNQPEVSHKLAIGDPVLSLRTLAKRLQHAETVDPNGELAYMYLFTNSLSRTDTSPSDFFYSICAPFAFRAGGTRFVVDGPVTGKTVYIEDPATVGQPFTSYSKSAIYTTGELAIGRENVVATTEYNREISGALQVEFPYYSPYPMLWNFYRPVVGETNDYYLRPEIESQFYYQTSIKEGQQLRFYRAAADDFSCGYIIGAPMTIVI